MCVYIYILDFLYTAYIPRIHALSEPTSWPLGSLTCQSRWFFSTIRWRRYPSSVFTCRLTPGAGAKDWREVKPIMDGLRQSSVKKESFLSQRVRKGTGRIGTATDGYPKQYLCLVFL